MSPQRIEELAQEAWTRGPGASGDAVLDAIRTAVREALDAAADICEPGNDCADLLTYSEAIRRLRDELMP